MQWPGSVVSRYAFEKLRFLEMLSTRPFGVDPGVGRGVRKNQHCERAHLPKMDELRVVMEHHYDQQQSGESLTHDDLRFDVA